RAYSIAFCLRFTATAPPEFYTLSLHDALPISVVDQHVVARPQHLADGSRHDRQLPVPRRPLAGDHHLLAGDEDAWRGQVADPELRPLQVGDQSQRPAELGLDATDELRAGGVILVRAVR